MEAVNKRFQEVQSKSHALRKEQVMAGGWPADSASLLSRVPPDEGDSSGKNEWMHPCFHDECANIAVSESSCEKKGAGKARLPGSNSRGQLGGTESGGGCRRLTASSCLQNMKQGSLSTVKEGVLRATQDLDDVNFRNVDKRYRKQLVELMTTEMAVGDLEKYHKVRRLGGSASRRGSQPVCHGPGTALRM